MSNRDWPEGGGETGALLRSFDWSRTSLGAVASWPQSLRTAVDIIMASPVPMVMLWGSDGIMIYNDAYSGFAGGRHPRLFGSKVLEGWDEVADFNRHVMSVCLGGETLSFRDQHLILHRNGAPEDVWMNLDYSPVRDESGRPAGVLAIVVETTTRMRAEAAVREGDDFKRRAAAAVRDSELRYATLLDVSPQVVWFGDANAVITYCNHYWYEYTGLDVGDVDGDRWASTIHPEHRQHVLDAWKRAVATAGEWEMEIPFRRAADGVYRWHLARGTPVFDGAGAVERWIGVAFDIDDRKHAAERQAALVELSDSLRDVRDHDNIAITAAEILGRTLHAARAGYAAIDATGEYAVIEQEWTNGSVPSIVGRHRLQGFGGAFVDSLRRGEIMAVSDTRVDVATGGHADAFEQFDIRSLLNVPVIEDGLLAGILYIHDSVPRIWSVEDIALMRDIADRTWAATERSRTEAALRDSEQQFRALAEAVPHHVWTARPDGYLSWFNARVYDYAAAVPGELDGVGWATIVHPDDLAHAAATWAASLKDASVYQVEFRLRRGADAQFRWFLARAVPSRDTAGDIVRWIGTNTDVHDQKAIAEQLALLNRELEERVAERTADRDRMWRLSQDLMVVTRRDFEVTVVAVNPAWQSTLGHAEPELTGKSLLSLIHPDDLRSSEDAAATLVHGGEVRDFRNRFRHKDGTWRWIDWIGVTEGDYNVAVGRDVTSEMTAADTLRQTEDALRQSQKMEAVGQLTGGIAHDFNNLLQGIVGSLDLMQKRIAQGRANDLERFVSGAMTSANRAAALTHRLLAFSRRQPLDPKPVKINQLVASMEDLLRRTMGERIEIELVLAAGVWRTLCDQNQLESALLNLAINARDAMPDGGKLTVETGNAHLDSAYVATQRDVTAGQYVCLSVTDTGTGMPPDVVQRAFDPFFTTKPIGQGTGLGLSMIYGFARQSEGYAKIYSEVGEGTSVKLYLPRYRGIDAVDDTPPELIDVEGSDSGEIVLVVEDEAVVRALIVEILGDLGYRVLQAVDGPSALTILQSAQRVDLLVTDIGLPGLNGRQLADAARTRRSDLKVLFMTGYAENAALSRGFLEPGMEMMTKPFAIERLASRVRAMLETA